MKVVMVQGKIIWYDLDWLETGRFSDQTKNQTIIPLIKAGKSPSEVASFCPISLTSCVVKLLERIIAHRLYYTAERKHV